MKTRKWTDKEVDALILMAGEGKTNRQIADKLGRTLGAVQHKRCELGVTDEKLAEKRLRLEAEREEAARRDDAAQIEQLKEVIRDLAGDLSKAWDSLAELTAQHARTERDVKTLGGLINDHREVLTALRGDVNDMTAYLAQPGLRRLVKSFRIEIRERGGV